MATQKPLIIRTDKTMANDTKGYPEAVNNKDRKNNG
jgi:hypothetical protein